MIVVSSSGSSPSMDQTLETMLHVGIIEKLNDIGNAGVFALGSVTPVDSGLTAESWSYEIDLTNGIYTIIWNNNNDDKDGVPVAILIQYGHGTGTGGWVEGRDYVNPAMQPLFDQFADDVWEEVTNAR